MLTNEEAKTVHNSWMNEKLFIGWKYGPEADDNKKTHPCLVPFEELPEYCKKCEHILAESGEDGILLRLGDCYYKGKGTVKNFEKAAALYQKAADLGNLTAYIHLGWCYEEGKGVLQDQKKAVDIYEECYAKGCIGAANSLAFCYELGIVKEPDLKKAVELYTIDAEKGHASAQSNLGLCYFDGKGVPVDYGKAYEWFEKAAAQNNAEAQYNLGFGYYFAYGVKNDYETAFKWFEKAAKQWHDKSLFFLGECYYNGTGVKKNIKKAFEWHERSANLGLGIAQVRLGDYYLQGSVVGKDYKKAFEWYKAAAEQDDVNAQERLGFCYYFGKGIKKDLSLAIDYWGKAFDGYDYSYYPFYCYEDDGNSYLCKGDLITEIDDWYIAAVNGNNEAQYKLGLFWLKGQKDEKGKWIFEPVKAAAEIYFRESADSGHERAQCELGKILLYKGDAESVTEALSNWFIKSAAVKPGLSNGDPEAQFYLGYYFYFGGEIKKAKYWYELSAKNSYGRAFNNLGIIYAEEGDTEKAIDCFEKADAKGSEAAANNLKSLKNGTNHFSIEEPQRI